ncbi:MAG: response regulator [Bryobacteraceae bacterium]|jgi:CheY-like chemotaxis protein
MNRILLVDDSPHAQRMGERILSDEGFEVVTVSNADAALVRLEDVDPDVIVADTVMPGRTGYEICQYVKMSPRHRHVKVILTAGVLEPFEEERIRQAEADGSLKKPFEASALVGLVRPLAEASAAARADAAAKTSSSAVAKAPAPPAAPFIAVVDAEQVRAAVTVALDASMTDMVEEISRRVIAALSVRKHEAAAPVPAIAPPVAPIAPEQPRVAEPPPAAPRPDIVRRVTPVRARPSSGFFVSLDINRPDPE